MQIFQEKRRKKANSACKELQVQSNLDISNLDISNSAKYILIAFSDHNLVLETFLQVQITQSAN